MLTFQEYAQAIIVEFDVSSDEVAEESSRLTEDLGIDSLQAFELLIFTEQLARLKVRLAEMPAITSLGDAYRYYARCCE